MSTRSAREREARMEARRRQATIARGRKPGKKHHAGDECCSPAGPSGPATKFEEKPLLAIGNWIRNKGKLDDINAVVQGKRVNAFDGLELVELIMMQRFSAQNKKHRSIEGKKDAVKLAQDMLGEGYFVHADEKTDVLEKKYREYIELVPSEKREFVEDGLYIWVLKESQTTVYLQSFGMLVCILAVCMIKVWPLWMKVVVWWMSLIYLISSLTLIVLRLVVYVLCFAVGFRGVWVLPNLLDDDIDIVQCFTPLIAQEEKYKKKSKAQREADRQRAEERAAERKKAQKQAAESKKLSKVEKMRIAKNQKEDREVVQGGGWEFGVANLAVILAIAFYGCKYMGMFDPDMVPEFLVSDRLGLYNFMSLEAPEDVLARAAEQEAAEQQDTHGDATMTDEEAAEAAKAAKNEDDEALHGWSAAMEDFDDDLDDDEAEADEAELDD